VTAKKKEGRNFKRIDEKIAYYLNWIGSFEYYSKMCVWFGEDELKLGKWITKRARKKRMSDDILDTDAADVDYASIFIIGIIFFVAFIFWFSYKFLHWWRFG